MSGYKLGLCLVTLDRSVPELARRTGEHKTTIWRWIRNEKEIPCETARRLERLSAAIAADPFPRRTGLRQAPDLVVLSLGQAEAGSSRADARRRLDVVASGDRPSA